MQSIDTKECRQCHQVKPLDAFSKVSRNKDGLNTICRECHAAYQREWRRNNPGKAAAYSRKYYSEHVDEHREYSKRYYAEHREECLARSRAWSQANRELLSDYRKRYYEKYKPRRKLLRVMRELGA